MSASHQSILIVEDDESLNDAYSMILESAGYEVIRAENGEEALNQLKSAKRQPDIILLDLRMPVLDGIGFLKQYEPVKHPDTVVVVFSNYDSHNDIDEAYQLGAHRYVLKARAAPKELLRLVESVAQEKSLK